MLGASRHSTDSDSDALSLLESAFIALIFVKVAPKMFAHFMRRMEQSLSQWAIRFSTILRCFS
jgi:hypothetical protein